MREKALVDDEVDLLSFKEALKKLQLIDRCQFKSIFYSPFSLFIKARISSRIFS